MSLHFYYSGFYNLAAARRPQISLVPKRELYRSSVRELYVSQSHKTFLKWRIPNVYAY